MAMAADRSHARQGLSVITLGREATPEDRARAIALNDQWDKVRRGIADGVEPALLEPIYPRVASAEHISAP